MTNAERPLIAVTTTLAPTGSYGLPGVKLNAQYIASIEAPGGTALLITPTHDAASVERIVGLAHALVLTGGEDVDPTRYGQEPHPSVGDVSPERDAAEFAALEAAIRRGIPVLGICRGMQLLNVAMGGTLYQDLPSQRHNGVIHEQAAPVTQRWHGATVADDTGIARIFGTRELFINSFHHQGVERVGTGLRACVWAEDGLVEGIEGEGSAWMYGVQWHPERGEAEAPDDQRSPDRRLFWALIQAAREFAARSSAADLVSAG